jgi:hypothetical protein
VYELESYPFRAARNSGKAKTALPLESNISVSKALFAEESGAGDSFRSVVVRGQQLKSTALFFLDILKLSNRIQVDSMYQSVGCRRGYGVVVAVSGNTQ